MKNKKDQDFLPTVGKGKAKKTKAPAHVVVSDVDPNALIDNEGEIDVQGVKLEYRRTNFGLALYQSVVAKYFDGNTDEMGMVDMAMLSSYAFTRKSRNDLRRSPVKGKEQLCHELARCSFDEWCDLVGDINSHVLQVLSIYASTTPESVDEDEEAKNDSAGSAPNS